MVAIFGLSTPSIGSQKLRPVSRSHLLLAGAVVVVAYGTLVLALVVTGDLPTWWAEKTSGIARLAGAVQETGFNAPGSPSLASRLLENQGQFASSYAVLVLGAAATAGLAWGLWQRRETVDQDAADVTALGLVVWQLSAWG